MANVERPELRSGDAAPDFKVAAVDRQGSVSLADYRERTPLFLAILRGLWCSYCRRYLVQLGSLRKRLDELGIETLAIVASDPDRVRLYTKFHPVRVRLGADLALITHSSYGLPTSPRTPELEHVSAQQRIRVDRFAVNPDDLSQLTAAIQAVHRGSPIEREWPAPDIVRATRTLYPYEMTKDEEEHRARNEALETGQFLIDRHGVIRWTRRQRATELPVGLGNYPSEDEIVAAAQRL